MPCVVVIVRLRMAVILDAVRTTLLEYFDAVLMQGHHFFKTRRLTNLYLPSTCGVLRGEEVFGARSVKNLLSNMRQKFFRRGAPKERTKNHRGVRLHGYSEWVGKCQRY